MRQVPAFCDICGTIFSLGDGVEKNRIVPSPDHTIGSCPSCGKRGRIPQDFEEVLAGAVKLLTGPGRTKSELQQLGTYLGRAYIQRTSINELCSNIKRDLPTLSSFADYLYEIQTGVYQYILLIHNVLSVLLMRDQNDISITPTQIEDVIEMAIQYCFDQR